jgi:tRNA pseudouridine13 synthase
LMEILTLPYMTKDLPSIGGIIRDEYEDFTVEEIAVYKPDDEGQHLLVNLTREGETTRDLARQLSSLLGLKLRDIGFAGLKDKRARVTQTFSIPVGQADEESVEYIVDSISGELPVEINWARLHRRKLRAGHLLGNRFTITVRDLEIPVEEALSRARAISCRLRETGLPNYYGEQRFGYDNKNLWRGFEIIKGRRHETERWLRRFLVTSYLSLLCNRYLVRRVEEGLFGRLLRGDIAKKYSTGGLFEVEDVDAEQPRYEAHEISFTAPIYGPKMWEATGPSGDLEAGVFEGSGITIDELDRLNVMGTRRLGRLLPEVEVAPREGGLVLGFSLPKGAYATVVTREFMKTE